MVEFKQVLDLGLRIVLFIGIHYLIRAQSTCEILRFGFLAVVLSNLLQV